MEQKSFLTSVLIDQECFAIALVDSGCEVYAVISQRFANRCNLPRLPISTRTIEGITHDRYTVDEVAYAQIDIGGHLQQRVFFYVAPYLDGCQIMLGNPWLIKEKVILDQSERTLIFKKTGLRVKLDADLPKQQGKMVSATVFHLLAKQRKQRKCQIFTASLEEMDKSLKEKQPVDVQAKLPVWVDRRSLPLFDKREAEKLPPHGPEVD